MKKTRENLTGIYRDDGSGMLDEMKLKALLHEEPVPTFLQAFETALGELESLSLAEPFLYRNYKDGGIKQPQEPPVDTWDSIGSLGPRHHHIHGLNVSADGYQ